MTRPGLQDRRATPDEVELLSRLRAGDERAFESLVASHYGAMLAVAQPYVRSRAVAEEVVQETWLGVLRGLDRFEGRSSLKTWILRIVVNTAKTRGVREARTVPFASLSHESSGRPLPESALLEHETMQVAIAAIEALPPAQRTVITMRDVEGCTAGEVCAALEVSEGNQRVLLHRARSRVRAGLERYLQG